jgi:hypothetical protein
MTTSETASFTGITASHQPSAKRPVPNPARPFTRPPANAPMDTIIMTDKLISELNSLSRQIHSYCLRGLGAVPKI